METTEQESSTQWVILDVHRSKPSDEMTSTYYECI